MDGFVDLEEAIKAESQSRLNRVEKLAGFSALAILGAAVWLAWPTVSSGMSGDSITSDLKYAMIILAWGVFVQVDRGTVCAWISATLSSSKPLVPHPGGF